MAEAELSSSALQSWSPSAAEPALPAAVLDLSRSQRVLLPQISIHPCTLRHVHLASTGFRWARARYSRLTSEHRLS
jgi:hypothetical protein